MSVDGLAGYYDTVVHATGSVGFGKSDERVASETGLKPGSLRRQMRTSPDSRWIDRARTPHAVVENAFDDIHRFRNIP